MSSFVGWSTGKQWPRALEHFRSPASLREHITVRILRVCRHRCRKTETPHSRPLVVMKCLFVSRDSVSLEELASELRARIDSNDPSPRPKSKRVLISPIYKPALTWTIDRNRTAARTEAHEGVPQLVFRSAGSTAFFSRPRFLSFMLIFPYRY